MIYIGIDPGKSGCIAFIDSDSERDPWFVNCDETPKDIADAIADTSGFWPCFALVERVSSSPQMGVKSAFTFGQSFGMIEGMLAMAEIPHEQITPQKWMRQLQCLTKGDKNVTKRKAQELYPSVKITHRNADALLLAHLCMMQHK